MKHKMIKVFVVTAAALSLVAISIASAFATPEGTVYNGQASLDGGNYYLSEDKDISTLTISGTVTFDLNGYVLKGDGTGSVIKNNGTLTIKDSSVTSTSRQVHYFKVDNKGVWVLQGETLDETYTFDSVNGLRKNGSATTDIPAKDSVIAVYGGCITGGTGSTGYDAGKITGGGILNNGTLELQDVSIVGNKAGINTSGESGYTAGKGAGIYNVASSSLTTTDAAIVGNYANEQGAGIFNKNDTVTNTINGGYVSYNTADQYGAGFSTAGKVTLNDCTICGNTITMARRYGAGVDWWGGSLTLGGAVHIYDNLTDNTQDNLFMEFNLSAGGGYEATKLIGIMSEGLSENAKIGVWHHVDPIGQEIQLTAKDSGDYSDRFKGDIEGFGVAYDSTADHKYLVLKQDVFFVNDGIGSDTSGNGTLAKPYKTINKAIAEADGEGTVILLSNVTLSSDCQLTTDITIDLNGYTILFGGGKFKNPNDKEIVFPIASSADLEHACDISQQSGVDAVYRWKLQNDIKTKWTIAANAEGGNYKKIIIDGQGFTIRASNSDTTGPSQQQVFYFGNKLNAEKAVEISDLTLCVEDGFRSGICFDKENGRPGIDATLTDVSIAMKHTTAPRNSQGEPTLGAAIVNNGGNVVLNDGVEISTDAYSWAGIDLDASKGDVALTLSERSALSFLDGRTGDMKASEPFIGFDGVGSNKASVLNNSDVELYFFTYNRGDSNKKSGYDFEQKLVTITADNKSMKLGEAVPAFTASIEGFSYGGELSYDFAKIDVTEQGTYSIVPQGEESQGGYIVKYVPGTLTVSAPDPVPVPSTGDATPFALVVVAVLAAGAIAFIAHKREER